MRVLSIDVGIVNFCFCIVDFRDDEFDLVHVEKASIGTARQTAHDLTRSLVDFLRASEAINEKPINFVFFEAQMSRAIKNTILSYAAVTFFYTRSGTERSDVHIQFVQPRAKFRAIEEYFPGVVESQEMVCRANSRDLKKMSVQIARGIFTELNITRGLEALEKYKPKHDDVADVFLQSFAVYLEGYTGGGASGASGASRDGDPVRSRGKRRKRER